MPTGCRDAVQGIGKGPARGTVALWDWIKARWPAARSMGIYNPASRTDTTKQPSLHAEGRALDVGGPPDVMEAIFQWCIANADGIGLQELIYNRRIWSASRAAEGVRPYTANAHTDHVHIGQCWAGANGTTPFYAGKVLSAGSVGASSTPADDSRGGGASSPASSASANPLDAVGAAGAFLGRLTTWELWSRVILVVGGTAVAVAGVMLLVNELAPTILPELVGAG